MYIPQYLCTLVLAAIVMMNIIKADYLRALTSAIYVFICVLTMFVICRYEDLTKTFDELKKKNVVIHDELYCLRKDLEKVLRRHRELECLGEQNRQDNIRLRNEKNAIEKEANKIRQENRHLEAEIERLRHRI